MKNRGLIWQSAIALFGVAVMGSCSNGEEMFNESSLDEVKKIEFKENFETKYGAIPADKSWDFTTGESQLTRGFSTINTVVLDNGIDFGDLSGLKIVEKDRSWSYSEFQEGSVVGKNNDLFSAIFTTLPEKKEWQGKPAVLVAPSSSFYIFPLFLGGCLTFDLKVKVGDQEPVTVFTKDWRNFQTINGMEKDAQDGGGTINMKGIYIEAPVGTPIEIFLDNVYNKKTNKPYPTVGTTNGQVVYVDIPETIKPNLGDIKLEDNAVVKYIGIEDIQIGFSGDKTDKDYNDVVLAVVGNPDVPEEVIITNDKYDIKTNKAKRYMIEDLGATNDFDFNDIVVDVVEYTTTTHTVTYENGVLKTDNVTGVSHDPSKAFVRCLGGRLDFELTIGNTTWTKSGSGLEVGTMYNTQGDIDYNEELATFEVDGWDYDANNLSVKVDGQNGQVFTITFPKKGTAPMIIAVDPSQKWMKERISVPKSWFYEVKDEEE